MTMTDTIPIAAPLSTSTTVAVSTVRKTGRGDSPLRKRRNAEESRRAGEQGRRSTTVHRAAESAEGGTPICVISVFSEPP
jgi:hypothetical protein